MPEKNLKAKDKYLFFSSMELIDLFHNNLIEKDIKTQTKRIFEMARVFLAKKGFALEDIYSILVLFRDLEQRPVVNQVFQLYFREGFYPIRVIAQSNELEDAADLEMQFSAYRGEKSFISSIKDQPPAGPYSQVVILDNYAHCAGIRPLDPHTQKLVEGDFKQYVKQCLDNLSVILESVGTTLAQAYSLMVYLKEISNLTQVEEVFAEYGLAGDRIQELVAEVAGLYEDHPIEISCSAYIKG